MRQTKPSPDHSNAEATRPTMYKRIYVPVDNSDHSNAAVALGKAFEGQLVGSHVYAAKLHDVRFKQMEFTLPDEYKEETELEKQRKIHDALIARGLQLISDCYLNTMDELAAAAEVPFERKHSDGRNFECIVDDIQEGDYDLVLMGALGQGAIKYSKVGSVVERVMRRTQVDTFVVRNPQANTLDGQGRILVGLDGSSRSYAGLRAACAIARAGEGREIEILAIAHDGGAEKALLEAHLEVAADYVRRMELPVSTHCLTGATVDTFLSRLEEHPAWLVVVGRTGIDAHVGTEDIGSLAEALLRTSPSNVLISAGSFLPHVEQEADNRTQAGI